MTCPLPSVGTGHGVYQQPSFFSTRYKYCKNQNPSGFCLSLKIADSTQAATSKSLRSWLSFSDHLSMVTVLGFCWPAAMGSFTYGYSRQARPRTYLKCCGPVQSHMPKALCRKAILTGCVWEQAVIIERGRNQKEENESIL